MDSIHGKDTLIGQCRHSAVAYNEYHNLPMHRSRSSITRDDEMMLGETRRRCIGDANQWACGTTRITTGITNPRADNRAGK